MADSGSKMMLSVGGCEMALTEATLLPMVMQELSIQYPWYEPSSEQLKVSIKTAWVLTVIIFTVSCQS